MRSIVFAFTAVLPGPGGAPDFRQIQPAADSHLLLKPLLESPLIEGPPQEIFYQLRCGLASAHSRIVVRYSRAAPASNRFARLNRVNMSFAIT